MSHSEMPSTIVPVVGPRTQPASDHEPGRSVIWLHGEHDLATVETLSRMLARTIALEHRDIVLDLRGVRFMDASTVRAIVRARRALERRALTLVVRAPSPLAQRVLELCGLAELLDEPDRRWAARHRDEQLTTR